MVTSIAEQRVRAYLQQWDMPTVPILSTESNTIAGTTTAYRSHMVLTNVEVGSVRLHGCEQSGAERGVSEFGFGIGSGDVAFSGGGDLWIDDVSLRLEALQGGRGGAGGPLGCGGTLALTQLNLTGYYHGLEFLFVGDGVMRPDVPGFACDGYETLSTDPLESGWRWDGSGDRPPGLRSEVMSTLSEACRNPSVLERLTGRCLFVSAWPAAVLHSPALLAGPLLFGALGACLLTYCICCCRRRRRTSFRRTKGVGPVPEVGGQGHQDRHKAKQPGDFPIAPQQLQTILRRGVTVCGVNDVTMRTSS
ncbi:hypothetical protein EMIHUDRAFT_242647 [Emiliania huxleyi CCMP1516]|uniref:Uncharacterized protein n=2 Tax=Emiliania huxleyi TaxID=2903 RepID=A0A0D3J8A0_EMIH1|nr:hypothetical protein EMIHUDRAFT_242647 [Emiliania huxleyi CCMP1516]EOD19735.1 hypothetical protein EMIHUDRAFT_242647 [Emiliania huxleyi CCMP1516]|eukprot:XP_005772164.1 hypothetical protein EMIHUDRAFT_242647 [Emiliania huxleyi CCMP1516]